MLTERQHEILSLIADRTEVNARGDITMFWVPNTQNDYSPTLNRKVTVWGAGFVATLRAFDRKGYLKTHTIGKYSRSITEEGRLALEQYREATGFYRQ